MRFTTRLGLGLLLVGAVAILVSSGAFESIDADREVSLNATEDDSKALLNITYPRERQIDLESSDSEADFAYSTCDVFSNGCYQYEEIEIMRFSDNIPNGELEIVTNDSQGFDGTNFAVYNTNWEAQSSPELTAISASFECDATGFLFWWDQEQGTGSVEVDVRASDGNVTIDATRTVEVECVPD